MLDRTEAEEELWDMFGNREITSESEFRTAVLGIYDNILGQSGKSIFISQVIPKLQELYGDNYRKMGKRALDLIDEGGSKKQSQINEYFSSALVKEIELKKRMASISDIEKIICDSVLEGEEEFKSRCSSQYNVVGAVIYGSYAQGNQQPNSDLDIFYLLRWQNPTEINLDQIGTIDIDNPDELDYLDNICTTQTRTSDLDGIDYVDNFDPKKDFDFCKHLDSKLRRKLRVSIDKHFSSVVLDDKDRLLDLFYEDPVIDGKYKVVSPFNWVHDQVREYVTEYTQD